MTIEVRTANDADKSGILDVLKEVFDATCIFSVFHPFSVTQKQSFQNALQVDLARLDESHD